MFLLKRANLVIVYLSTTSQYSVVAIEGKHSSYKASELFKMGQPQHLFVYFILFRHKFYRKNCRLQQDSNSDRRKEGKHADHLTTRVVNLR